MKARAPKRNHAVRLLRASRRRASVGSTGFTLVEMLVAVALVLLMMTLFAQVFQGATNSMNRQKGMAENDQKARRLTVLLRGDLATRTFLDLIPFTAGQNTTALGNPGSRYDANRRQGYFSVSENDPNNNTDDVLQFTVNLASPVNGQPGQFFAGRATLLKRPQDIINQTPPNNPSLWTVDLVGEPSDPMNNTNEMMSFDNYVASRVPNQPEFDDGIYAPNVTGRSPAAEVSYFLRNGNLYRRVMLIRDGYDVDTAAGAAEHNPIGMSGEYGTVYAATYINPAPANYVIGSGQFWRDFDYSAFNLGYMYWDNATMMEDMMPTTSSPVVSRGMRFHTLSSLNNYSDDSAGPGGLPLSLGLPALRFGSTFFANDGGLRNESAPYALRPGRVPGWPREYDTNGRFIGRPTLQESAHSDFGYPGRIHNFLANHPNGENPLDPATTLNLDATSGTISQYSSEISRRGEDIVMTNVHEFDIQVYDDEASVKGFVQLGNATGSGHYCMARHVSRGSVANDRDLYSVNKYDTWHPQPGMPGAPPYRPISTGADGVNGAPGDDNGNTIFDAADPSELGWLGTDDEISLKAIQITVRYLDVASGQMRQLTLVHTLAQ